MVMAVGVAAPTPAMYHLTTHACFKALLFLGAGSVICALHHEQNIWKMGGVLWRMPVTGVTFLLATLALCGVPPFSGFFSKDEILAATLTGPHSSPLLFALAVAVAVLTTFYMFRLVIVAILGMPRADAASQAKESPRVMTLPLLALAVPSLLAGFWSIPGAYGEHLGHLELEHTTLAMIASLVAVVVGLLLAIRLYGGVKTDPLPEKLGQLATLLRQRFYLDELYQATVIRWNDLLATVADLIDRWVIAGVVVRGVHGTTELVGRALRLAQSGNLHTYAVLLVLGVAVVLYFVIGR
jgi:NADH-quinone oxidoreductase subunit L